MSQSSKLTATVAAAAIILAAQTASADMLTAIGPGEGEVSIVAWPGYIERGESDPAYDWVTGFEKATGTRVAVIQKSFTRPVTSAATANANGTVKPVNPR